MGVRKLRASAKLLDVRTFFKGVYHISTKVNRIAHGDLC
jgi:hypothetical protein